MPPHTSTENQKNKRKAELEELESRYADLGIDFKAHLEMSELADLAQRHGLKVEGPPGKKAFKRDYLFAVELHYANERIKAGNSPVEHLHPDFNGAARSTAYLRQLLTQYGFTYTTGPEPKHIGDASCVHLHQLFAQKVGEMRTIHSTVGKLVAAMEETVLAALQFVHPRRAARSHPRAAGPPGADSKRCRLAPGPQAPGYSGVY